MGIVRRCLVMVETGEGVGGIGVVEWWAEDPSLGIAPVVVEVGAQFRLTMSKLAGGGIRGQILGAPSQKGPL